MSGYRDRIDVLSDSGNVHRMFADQPVRRPGPPVTLGPLNGGTGTGTGNSAGCCAGCIDCKYMTVGGIFAQTYYVKPFPNKFIPGAEALGGTGILSLEYIGISDGSIAGTVAGNPYWQSDTFEHSCGATISGPCPDGTWFQTSASTMFDALTLDQRSGSVVSGSGTVTYIPTSETVPWSATFNTETGQLIISWTSGTLGACSLTYDLASGQTVQCNASFNVEKTAETGSCTGGDFGLTVTGSTGHPPASFSDNYFWRLVTSNDMNGTCPPEGSETAHLYLIAEGSGLACESLAGPNCGMACNDEATICGTCQWVWCAASGDPNPVEGVSCGDEPRTPFWSLYAQCSSGGGNCTCPEPPRDGLFHGEIYTIDCEFA